MAKNTWKPREVKDYFKNLGAEISSGKIYLNNRVTRMPTSEIDMRIMKKMNSDLKVGPTVAVGPSG